MSPSIESMRMVARRLAPLNIRFVFVGGVVMPLLVDQPELTEFRPTKDIDVIVEIVTYQQFSALEERLRVSGFCHDTSEGAPIFRWLVDGCLVDVMPMDAKPLGMASKWFPDALHLSRSADLGENCWANVIIPTLFLATKIEAFKDRGKDDYFSSRDMEDIITLVEGRAKIVDEVRSSRGDVREAIRNEFTLLLKDPGFHDAFPGHLSGITGARQRASLVMQRFEAIAS